MALIVKDRVRDTTTTTGTGAITLSGTAPLRYRAFASVCATSDTFPYAIVHQSVGVDEWEVGIGTLTASTTFARTTVLAGTNGTSAVVFSAGTKDVMMVYYGTPLALRTITGTSGQIAVTAGDGVAGNPTIAFDPGIVGPTIQKFTSGSGTYTTPAGVKWIRVRMVGGGGGGVGSGTAAGTVPTVGGNTTFGTTLLVANGGGIGTFALLVGGAGGTASLGSGPIGIAVDGGRGQSSGANSSGDSVANPGGNGGVSPFGGAGGGGLGSAAATAASTNSGSGGGGGGGANNANAVGGPGGGAGGFVDAIIVSPSATYSYAVGAAGNAGGAGTGGAAGAAGAAGLIAVEEYYNY